VTWAELDAALDDQGELLAGACEDLCSSVQGMSGDLLGCSLPDGVPDATAPIDTASPAAPVHCEYEVHLLCLGRDHLCLSGRQAGRGPTPVAAWLAGQARAEAASVKAFLLLARELLGFGAPSDLVDRCRDAACDEVRHARLIGGIAAQMGGSLEPLVFDPVRPRSILALAIENAVVGCVRETWAALVGHWQARHARSAMLRSAFAQIAADETRHGQLSLDIDAWLRTRLTRAEIDTLERARAAAVLELRDPDLGEDFENAEWLGLPSRRRSQELLRGLDDALWSVASMA